MQAGDSNTGLIKACEEGHVERATVLLDYGANVNYQNEVKEHLNSMYHSVIHTDWSCTIAWPISSLVCKLYW